MRTYEFRLYPNCQQHRRLDACLYETRQLYNEMLECEKQRYQQTGTFLSKYDLTALFKGRGGAYVPATTVQCLADRLTKALVVEELNIRALARSRLAKSILDASWSAFLTILSCKAASAGGQVVRINPRFTTQQCARCGEYVQKSLSVRTHICPSCGYAADRDVNAAQNILRAGARPSGTLADGLADEPRSRRL
jgi:IS605 OrfB family transposase